MSDQNKDDLFFLISQVWCRLRPEADLRPRPSTQSHFRLLNAVGQKKDPSSLEKHIETEDREKSSGQANLFNIWTLIAMDRTSVQPQENLSLLRSNKIPATGLLIRSKNSVKKDSDKISG